ncbi:MAG: YesL family protein [Lachnospiraceae bacterium]|nr:YesL family protein [Lachnospiraceae bacterium]
MAEQSKNRLRDNAIRHILFDVDGPVVTFLTKAGELILLSIMWILTCLPVITIGAASAALYHTVVKSVRHGIGYPVRSYFGNFRRLLKRGIIATIPLIVCAVLMFLFNRYVAHVEISLSTFAAKVLVIFTIIVTSVTVYLFPIISRFRVSVGRAVMMAFIVSGQHFFVTLLHVAALGGLVYTAFYILPIPSLFILPAILCYLSSLLMEKVLRKYMPDKPDEGSEALWLYE